MDPDKNLIYTRRKARQEQLAQSDAMPEESTVKFPLVVPTYRKQNLENVLVAHMQVTSYSSQSLIFKFSVILTQCLEWTVIG